MLFVVLAENTHWFYFHSMYGHVYGVPYFSELHSLVLFIVLGEGADDVFVLVDSWNSDDVYKATYLWTKYSYHESIVDSFVNLLLQLLQCCDALEDYSDS